ncbi:MAG: AAA family ATPase [Polyangiales bacterium]
MEAIRQEQSALPQGDSAVDLQSARAAIERLARRARAVIVGRDQVIDLVLTALLADGHVLLEDYPGSGKTTLARCLGDSLEGHASDAFAAFRRIQFTPDLLPSDVTGTSVFDLEHSRFVFRAGPIFAHVVLADEINRTSPKVQAAMLEAMAEKQVTIDNETHPLDPLFFVIATQNPLDVAGTYPLPTPQLDRFLFKLEMKHIARDAELDVLKQYPRPSLDMSAGLPRVSRDELLAARRSIRTGVHIAEPIREALVDLARGLRADERVLQGASTRSLVLMLPALQVRALMSGRDYVSPADVEALAQPIFGHRIECVPGVLDKGEVIVASLAPVVERLARASLSR